MRRPNKRRGGGACCLLALLAFAGAVMCISFFSIKFLLCAVAVLFIVLGICLMRL